MRVRLQVQRRGAHLAYSQALQKPPVADEIRSYGLVHYAALAVCGSGRRI
jgi:hypothetical protein